MLPLGAVVVAKVLRQFRDILVPSGSRRIFGDSSRNKLCYHIFSVGRLSQPDWHYENVNSQVIMRRQIRALSSPVFRSSKIPSDDLACGWKSYGAQLSQAEDSHRAVVPTITGCFFFPFSWKIAVPRYGTRQSP